MKNTFVALITVLLAGVSQASTEKQIYITNTDVVNLAVKDSAVRLVVAYPGKEISGLCGIEVRADSLRREIAVQKFLDAINIGDGYGSLSNVTNTTLSFDLLSGSYLGWVTISTKDGRSLQETINATLGDQRTVVALATTCR